MSSNLTNHLCAISAGLTSDLSAISVNLSSHLQFILDYYNICLNLVSLIYEFGHLVMSISVDYGGETVSNF